MISLHRLVIFALVMLILCCAAAFKNPRRSHLG